MARVSPRVYLARAEMTLFIQQLIEKFDLDDREIASLAGSFFRDALTTSLVVNPRAREDEEPFLNHNFQYLLNDTVQMWREYSEEMRLE